GGHHRKADAFRAQLAVCGIDVWHHEADAGVASDQLLEVLIAALHGGDPDVERTGIEARITEFIGAEEQAQTKYALVELDRTAQITDLHVVVAHGDVHRSLLSDVAHRAGNIAFAVFKTNQGADADDLLLVEQDLAAAGDDRGFDRGQVFHRDRAFV